MEVMANVLLHRMLYTVNSDEDMQNSGKEKSTVSFWQVCMSTDWKWWNVWAKSRSPCRYWDL